MRKREGGTRVSSRFGRMVRNEKEDLEMCEAVGKTGWVVYLVGV